MLLEIRDVTKTYGKGRHRPNSPLEPIRLQRDG
jgi:hypothetical protein